MTSPTIPVAGSVLDGESVKLLQKGDVLRVSENGMACAAIGDIMVVADGGGALVYCHRPEDTDFVWQRIPPYRFTFIGRPDQDGWIDWSGGENPVPGTQVDVRFSDHEVLSGRAGGFHWRHRAEAGWSNIIAFRPHREVSEGLGSFPQEAEIPTEQTDEPAGLSPRYVVVPLSMAPFPPPFLDAINGYAAGGSTRCLEAIQAEGSWLLAEVASKARLSQPVAAEGQVPGQAEESWMERALSAEASMDAIRRIEDAKVFGTNGMGAPCKCFHCGYVAVTREEGLLHFGRAEDCTPICGVAAETYRSMEQSVWEYRNECDAASKTFYSLGAEHQTKLREAEQAGYDRGLSDGQALAGNAASCAVGMSEANEPKPLSPTPSEGGVEPQLLRRLAYGYELMHRTLSHMAGTSGASGRWYYDKANEVFDRISPVFDLTPESNAAKSGDCLSNYMRAVEKIEALASPTHQASDVSGLVEGVADLIEKHTYVMSKHNPDLARVAGHNSCAQEILKFLAQAQQVKS